MQKERKRNNEERRRKPERNKDKSSEDERERGKNGTRGMYDNDVNCLKLINYQLMKMYWGVEVFPGALIHASVVCIGC
jgi:hypothetical protein